MNKKPMGRPPVEFDWSKLDAILQFGARLIDCHGIMDVADVTIEDKIKKKYGMSFGQYRDLRMSTMRQKLLQKQFDIAMQGNVTMLIWLGKQHLGQSDKLETELVSANIHINVDKQDTGL